MGSRNRNRHNGQSHWNRTPGMQPGDSIGNRRSFKEIRVPADDIGNRSQSRRRAEFSRDDIGNSIDVAPTHSLNSAMVGNDGKVKRTKEQSHANNVRVGRYIVGGVNPVIAGGSNAHIPEESSGGFASQEGGRNQRNKKKRKNRRQENDNVTSISESAERRLKRLFDFDSDDRFEYILTSKPEEKRLAALNVVQTIIKKAGLAVDVEAKILKNKERLAVLVVLGESGDMAIFQKGGLELTALNFLVNKIVNRYPNDRIRLAVLPASDEKAYTTHFEALETALEKKEIKEAV